MVLLNMTGAVAFVTGGVSGLGAATSERLMKEGVNVFAIDLNEEKGETFRKEVASKYPKASFGFMEVDVTKEDQVAKAVEKAATMGPVRIVVNCAGLGAPSKVLSAKGKPMAMSFWDKILDINLKGTIHCTRLGAAAMCKTETISPDGDRGVVINVASVAAFEGQVGQTAYSAAKAGVAGMTLPLARDLASHGIRVCTVAPGIIDTPMMAAAPPELRAGLSSEVVFPKRLGQAEEFANLAWTIIQTPYLNGETIRLDGGIRMQPKSRL